MRIAYADPPYPGQALKLYRKYDALAAEVDHAALIAHLEEYDGWALSTSSRALRDVLPLCPNGIRVGAWVRRNPQLKRGIHPTDAWEPVIFKPVKRKQPRGVLLDWCEAHPVTGALAPRRHIIGRKPDAFCIWVFRMVRALPCDEFTDIFPGSGAVGRAWDAWTRQQELLTA